MYILSVESGRIWGDVSGRFRGHAISDMNVSDRSHLVTLAELSGGGLLEKRRLAFFIAQWHLASLPMSIWCVMCVNTKATGQSWFSFK